ncbi:YxiG family protein [Bacillus velezensis]|uniref:YxiG family protein n=1 Tax=Bacillus velezensis TaxID=492670 RepID=UPI00336A096A
MYKTINEWVDFIDGGCAVLHFDFQVFKKELSLKIQVVENKAEYTHNILFQNVASVYFSADIGDMRLEKIDPEEYNWQVFEMSYHPEGIGNLSNAVIPEYQSNANFLIDMNRMLIAIEAETVRFDDQSFYAYHSKS